MLSQTIKRLLFFLLMLIPSLAYGQGGTATLIRVSAEPLPNCTPATQPYQSQPLIWDITSQQMKTCTAANVWTPFPNAVGTGTVSLVSVSGTTSPLMTISVASPSTTPVITFSLSTAAAHAVYIGPASGGAVVPTFRALGATDLPVILLANTPLTTNGDLLTVIGGVLARLGQGANGTFLGVSGGTLQFITPTGAGNVTTTTATLNAVMIGQSGTAIAPLASRVEWCPVNLGWRRLSSRFRTAEPREHKRHHRKSSCRKSGKRYGCQRNYLLARR